MSIITADTSLMMSLRNVKEEELSIPLRFDFFVNSLLDHLDQ